MLLNRGNRFKRSFLLSIDDGKREISLVIKCHKRRRQKRFDRELEPRGLSQLSEYGPRLIFSDVSIKHTRDNTMFELGDYALFVEEYIEGRDLADIIQFPNGADVLGYAEICEEVYLKLGELMRVSLGRVLSNVNPSNIRISAQNGRPVVLDWGGQGERELNWYRQLVQERIAMPALASVD